MLGALVLPRTLAEEEGMVVRFDFFPEAAIEGIAAQVERAVLDIVEAAKK